VTQHDDLKNALRRLRAEAPLDVAASESAEALGAYALARQGACATAPPLIPLIVQWAAWAAENNGPKTVRRFALTVVDSSLYVNGRLAIGRLESGTIGILRILASYLSESPGVPVSTDQLTTSLDLSPAALAQRIRRLRSAMAASIDGTGIDPGDDLPIILSRPGYRLNPDLVERVQFARGDQPLRWAAETDGTIDLVDADVVHLFQKRRNTAHG